MNELNDEQKQAVASDSSAIAIVAGPGTGKTKTLVARLEYLLSVKKVSPDKILALTFTKKAAAEMKDRLNVKQKPFVGTFHALALHLLSNNGSPFQTEPTIISQEQQLEIVTKKELLQISTAKSNFEETELVKKYNTKLGELGLIDYDDLLLQLYGYLKHNSGLRLDHVLVDEFQDTNPLQYKILKLLNAKNYFVIGDPKQSIYSFRGTNEKIFEQFLTDFPNALLVILKQNYRSAPEIISTYEKLFSEKQLVPVLTNLGETYLLETLNEFSEADYIVSFIKNRAGGLDLRDASDASANLSDFAILYRTHHFSKILQKKFSESGIPFQVVGGEGLNQNQQIESFIKINCVTLLTMHASKGLEFEYVFVCGFEDGIIPHKNSDLEEEKRLLYVAMSRARRGLYLTRAKHRNSKPRQQSQFLDNLLLEAKFDEESVKKEARIKRNKLKKSQMNMF